MDDRRRQILDAALAIADEDGLDGVTMRAVAARVGVSPMALYPHVGSKAALLDGLVERLLSELPRPSGDDWRVGLRDMAYALRGLAKVHPAAFPLLLARPSVTPLAAGVVDAVYGGLLSAGVPPEHVGRLERMISTFVLGFALSEVNGRFAVDDPRLRTRRGTALPAHQALGEHLTEVDWDAEFEADLRDFELVVNSVAGRAPAPRSAGSPPPADPPAGRSGTRR